MKKIILFACLLISLLGNAQAGSIDSSFNVSDLGFGKGDGANSWIRTSIIQPDGKIIIGGGFTTYNGVPRPLIVRLNPDGTLDTSFNVGTIPSYSINKIVLQSDGKIVFAGNFRSYNGNACNNIGRLNSDGSLDTTFKSGTAVNEPADSLDTLCVQADDKIIVGGNIRSYNGTPCNYIVRLNADGSVDTSFNTGTGFTNIVYSISLAPEGKIIVGGAFTTYNGTACKYLCRINADGSLDTSFNTGTGPSDYVYDINTQTDGRIIIGGRFTSYNGKAINRIARLETDGSMDLFFTPGTGANGIVYSTNIQPDGKIIVGGAFTAFNDGSSRKYLTRLNANGTPDLTFNTGTGPDAVVYATSLLGNGKMIVTGVFTKYNGVIKNRIARLFADGTLDTTFNPSNGANGIIYSTSLQPDGKIIIAGNFTSLNGVARSRIARINSDDSLDTTFNPGSGADGEIRSITLQPDGKILIAGDFTTYNGTARKRIARINADGSLDATFDSSNYGPNQLVNQVILQPDGKVIVVGKFTVYGLARNRIARINTDGTVDSTFNASWVDNDVNSVALQPDGKIIIGGNFDTTFGAIFNRIGRLNTNGSQDGTFNASANATVLSIALQPDGKIIIGGNFTTYKGVARNRIARLNADGTLDTTFDVGSGADSSVSSIYVLPDGKIVIGGYFSTYNGTIQNKIARLNIDGSVDTTFNSGTGANAEVNSVSFLPDGKLIIGGAFTAYNGIGRNRIARIYGVTNYTSISDANFEQALIDLGLDTAPIDGKVPTANIAGVTNLDISNKNISNLTGIQDFAALTSLNCSYNQLTSLDITKNTALTYLDCSHNKLQSTNVSGKMSISATLNVSNNTALTYLNCSYNQLTALDVTKKTALTYLDCSYNRLSALDVTKNTALTYLDCSNNQLVNLNINNGNNSIMTIFNATNNPALTAILTDSIIPPNFGWTKDTTAYYISANLSSSAFEKESSIMLYPNPADDVINISGQEITQVIVMNFLGQQLINKFIYTNPTMVDISSLSGGTYLVKVISGNQSTVIKVVKK